MSPSPKHWWAASSASARWSAVGGTALVTGLLAVSAIVWSAPGSAAPPPSTEAQLAAALEENAQLRAELEASATPRAQTPATTPTPTPTPISTPTPTPDAGGGPGAGAPPAPPVPRDTLVVTRTVRVPVEVQPHPTAPDTPAPTTAAPVTAPPKAQLVTPQQRYFGMYTTQSPFNFATFDDIAFKLGVRQSLVGYFSGWDKPFRADAVTRSWERGLLPILTWESTPSAAGNDEPVQPDYTLSKIIDGGFDDYLRQYARDVTATGLPLAIRLDHEMNGSWYPWSEMRGDGSPLNTNSRGEYVSMWRHVHDIFEQEGANAYVVWVWAPNVINNLSATLKDPAYLASLYPGDEYVDWVGLSGYLRPTTNPQNRSFSYTFDPSLTQLRAITDKPILLAEVGATESGGRKPEWVTSFFDAFTDPANADIIGFAWFNITVTTISGGERVTNDWRVDSRADSLDAFREGLTDPMAGFALRPY